MKEIWKNSYYFPEKYSVSSYGRLKNKEKNYIYKMTNKKNDYFSKVLYYKKEIKSIRVHRIVAKTFIDNPNKYPEVNHKDGNKQNNRLDNLEWCTSKYNTQDAIKRNPKIINGMLFYNKNRAYKNIIQLSKNDEVIKKHNNVKEAFIDTGICQRNILQCLHKQRKTAGKYKWVLESEVVS